MKIANTGDETINDWALEFDFDHEIQNMWNATVVEHSEDNYVVKNNDWNANIKPGEGAGFGMTVQCEGDIAFPDNFSFVMEEESVTAQSYSAEFTLYSDWGTGCNGAIILSNLTTESIENWQLEFDYDREIVNISNAVIVSCEQGHYVIKNAEYNADIAANSSVHIGIVAGEGAADERPENFTMQQTVVGDATTGTEGGSEEAPEEETPELSDEEKEAIIAERLKGVKYTEPAEEHIKYDEATDTYYVDNQLLIVTWEGVTLEEVESFAADFSAAVVGYIVLTGDYQIEFSESKTLDELEALMEKIFASEMVEDVMLHGMFEMSLSGVSEWYDEDVEKAKWDTEWDAKFPNGANWGLEAINAMGAWEYEGDTVNVGIIDTVIDDGHEDLGLNAEKVLLNSNRVAMNYEKSSRKTYITYAHGTHVAGTIAAMHNNGIGIEGVANNVELYAVANNGKGSVDGTELISYMRFKYALASLIFRECKVINVSMGTTSDDWEYEGNLYGEYLNKFLRLGYDFVIVQAAGNDKADAREAGLFAGIEQEEVKNRVIVVGAVGVRSSLGVIVDNYLWRLLGGKEYTVCGYEYWVESNYGERVDVCAPGVNIYSTLPGNRYSNIEWGEETWTGTSMAAPHVSGVAAMCYSVNPQLTGAQVKEIICENAVRYVTREADGSKYALVNASLAVEAASKTEGNMPDLDKIETGAIVGRIYEYDTLEANVPNNGELEAKDVEVFFYRVSESDGVLKECADSIKATSDGTFSSILPVGIYSIVVFSEDYLPVLYTNVEVKEGETEVVKISAYIVKDQNDDQNVVSGTVYDAVTGEALSDVDIHILLGHLDSAEDIVEKIAFAEENLNVSEGIYSSGRTLSTDEQGRYTCELAPGYYTFVLQKEGYIVGSIHVISLADEKGNQGVLKQDATLSPELKEGEYRIILTWGAKPSDLDSHLKRYDNEVCKFHVYYGNRYYVEGGEIVAFLDRDDVTAYGPETVTLTLQVDENSRYEYYVRDFTNGGNSESLALSLSGAKVEVYFENDKIEEFTVSPNQCGTVWNVFEIINGKIQCIDEVE